MADEPNLIIEHLRKIRSSQERMELDVADLKTRASSVELITGQILQSLANVNQRMDRFDERLARIERRLELTDA